jgi:hypothetical protein
MSSIPKLWQVKVDNQIYNATTNEIELKIRNGIILRQDQVRSSNLPWVEIGCVSEFDEVFAEELWIHLSATANNAEKEVYTHFQVGTGERVLSSEERANLKSCFLHSELPPFYKCICCENLFCKTCPTINEQKEVFCPMCGGLCEIYLKRLWTMPAEIKEATYDLQVEKEEADDEDKIEYAKLTGADFLSALTYPFRFPLSLLIGGGIFSTLIFGIFITTFRGDWTFWISLLLISFIIMLKFGVLTKTYDIFLRDDFKRGYLPRLNKYTFWEDFINPLFMGVGVYIVSFGLFLALSILAGVMTWFTFSSNLKTIENEMVKEGSRLNSTIQLSETAHQIKKIDDYELRHMINEMRLNQLESTFGHNHLLDNKEMEKFINSVMRLTLYFQMPVFLAFIIGILYFPAVCLTTGNIHFIGKIRFTKGVKAMKKLGFDYLKILSLCFGLLTIFSIIIIILDSIFAKLELPIAGVFLTIIVGALFIFYFWTVLSSILAITSTKK